MAKPSDKHIHPKKYDASTLFSREDNDPLAGIYDKPLVEKFAETRYFYNPKTNNVSNVLNGDNFNRNAGAAQLYSTASPFPATPPPPIGSPVNSLSDLIRTNDNKRTSYGHSERFNMRDLLDNYVDPTDLHEIAPPSYYVNSKYDNEREILNNLLINAPSYKNYLQRNQAIVKMWSEWPACTTDNPYGGSCQNFINDIMPEGSKYGYIAKGDTNANEIASQQLRNAYSNYMKQSKQHQEAPDHKEPEDYKEDD